MLSRKLKLIRRSRSALIYAASLGASIGIFFLIRYFGHSLVATASPGPQGPVRPETCEAPGILLLVLLAHAVILMVAHILGAIFRKMHQPRLWERWSPGLLGPSFLGWLAPDLAFQVLPANIAPYLAVISQVGVVLYMFLVGLDLDVTLLQKRTQVSIAISHASIVAPFLLGAAFALWSLSVSGLRSDRSSNVSRIGRALPYTTACVSTTPTLTLCSSSDSLRAHYRFRE